jgi:hypothetical protein
MLSARGRRAVHAGAFAVAAGAVAASVAAMCGSPPLAKCRDDAPRALSTCRALRPSALSDVLTAAISLECARAFIAAQVALARAGWPVAAGEVPLDRVISALLLHKAHLIAPESPDLVVLQVAPVRDSKSQDAVSDELPRFVEAHGDRVLAVILSPELFVRPSILERYGSALVAGMRLWQEYVESQATISHPPVPSDDAVLDPTDLVALDELMILLGRVCELAMFRKFDVIIGLGSSGEERVFTRRRGTSFESGGTYTHTKKSRDNERGICDPAKVSERRDFSAQELDIRVQSSTTSPSSSPVTTAAIFSGRHSSPSFNRAVAVAHIATCLARSFSIAPFCRVGEQERTAFPSLLLSADSTRDLRAVELLSDHTHVSLSIRLNPSQSSTVHTAYVESLAATPAVLAVAGLQRIPSGQLSHPAVLEYTRGIGDLQTARLRDSLRISHIYNDKLADHVHGPSLSSARRPRALIRRVFVGNGSAALHAATARTPVARDALRIESAALWCRVRFLFGQCNQLTAL